jgi:hypothetical protein
MKLVRRNDQSVVKQKHFRSSSARGQTFHRHARHVIDSLAIMTGKSLS